MDIHCDIIRRPRKTTEEVVIPGFRSSVGWKVVCRRIPAADTAITGNQLRRLCDKLKGVCQPTYILRGVENSAHRHRCRGFIRISLPALRHTAVPFAPAPVAAHSLGDHIILHVFRGQQIVDNVLRDGLVWGVQHISFCVPAIPVLHEDVQVPRVRVYSQSGHGNTILLQGQG